MSPTLLALLLAAGCAADAPPSTAERPPSRAATAEAPLAADVVRVEVTGEPGAYTFAVTVASPETGCDRYADWWEVVSPEGELIFRRILRHSHPDEQPFTRSGGPVPVPAGATVLVRAHLHAGSGDGYGGRVARGTPASGFDETASLPGDFAASLAQAPPLPDGCLF